MKKRILSLVMALTLMLTLAFASMPASAAEKIEDPREGVALVYVYFEVDNVGQMGYADGGSCFFVGDLDKDPQYCVTNCHVIQNYYIDCGEGELMNVPGSMLGVDGASFTGRGKIRIYFDANEYIEASCVEYDTKKDLALLKLVKPTNKRKALPLKVATNEMVGKTTVRAVGFPGLSDNVYASPTSRWGLSDISVTSGHISRILTTSGTGNENLQLDVEIKHGNSGGPLVDEEGNVLGVTTWGTPEGATEELKYAVSISEVIPLLKRNNVSFVDNSNGSSSSSSSSNDTDWTLIIIIAASAVVLILIIVIILIAVKNGKKKSQAQIDQAKAQAAQAQAMAAQAQAQAQAQAAQAQAAANAKPVLTPTVRSLSIQHRGMSVPITSGQIMIGRNRSDCALCYSSSTPGVSGRHCSVSFDPNTGDFILTDLKSSYGTFLQNGQKLNPLVQYRLRSGDRFYVGDPGNMIVVELR